MRCGLCGADIADCSAVRVLALLDNEHNVNPSLVVHTLCGSLARIAKIHIVRVWAHPDGAPLPVGDDFSDWGDDDEGPKGRPEGGEWEPIKNSCKRKDRLSPEVHAQP